MCNSFNPLRLKINTATIRLKINTATSLRWIILSRDGNEGGKYKDPHPHPLIFIPILIHVLESSSPSFPSGDINESSSPPPT